ncbi:MAG: hypothetical protein RL143_529 [Pseudomonadota bacterium]
MPAGLWQHPIESEGVDRYSRCRQGVREDRPNSIRKHHVANPRARSGACSNAEDLECGSPRVGDGRVREQRQVDRPTLKPLEHRQVRCSGRGRTFRGGVAGSGQRSDPRRRSRQGRRSGGGGGDGEGPSLRVAIDELDMCQHLQFVERGKRFTQCREKFVHPLSQYWTLVDVDQFVTRSASKTYQ